MMKGKHAKLNNTRISFLEMPDVKKNYKMTSYVPGLRIGLSRCCHAGKDKNSRLQLAT
jgi:hypothetical protein